MDSIKRISFLLKKHQLNQLSAAEWEELNRWAMEDPANKMLLDEFAPSNDANLHSILQEKDQSQILMPSFESVLAKLPAEPKPIQYRLNKALFIAAASLILLLGTVILIHQQQHHQFAETLSSMSPKTTPGNYRALLRSDKGDVYELHDKDGITVKEGFLSFGNQKMNTNSLAKAEQLSLFVPKGGTYQIELEDGSKIWLNADSKLVFPSHFAAEQRKVYLEGEAYFEVSKDKNRPFIVVHKQQEITVLGTAFNLKAYPEDKAVYTTLYEGKVQVFDQHHATKVFLLPGEQSILTSNHDLEKRKANGQGAKAWREGVFSFQNTNFEEVIKQVARWYNVDVKFNGPIPIANFSGEVSRNVSFDIMLEFLKGSGINLQLDQGTLIINESMEK